MLLAITVNTTFWKSQSSQVFNYWWYLETLLYASFSAQSCYFPSSNFTLLPSKMVDTDYTRITQFLSKDVTFKEGLLVCLMWIATSVRHSVYCPKH